MFNKPNLIIYSTGNTPRDLNLFVGKERIEGIRSLCFSKIIPMEIITVTLEVFLVCPTVTNLKWNMQIIETDNQPDKTIFKVGKKTLRGVLSYSIEKLDKGCEALIATITVQVKQLGK